MTNLQTKRKSEMTDDERIRDFQRKLYRKAKQEKGFRFYVLYDKVSIGYFLKEAYRRVKKNGGTPGVDGITFKVIERKGLPEYLSEIQNELKTRTYKPSPVLRVKIPKSDGSKRPLGIPTIKDRIVQMSCKMVIEPIYEADFEESSYGFRPKRSAADAIKKIKEYLKTDNNEILDADLSKFFDTIPHNKLMILLAQRISDKNILRLIKMWLKAPVIDNTGNYISGKKKKVGTPQGGVISPLLANVYLHLVDKIINKAGGIFKKCGITIVRYADDFVLLGKEIPEIILLKLISLLTRMDLKLNENKTVKCNVKKKSFNFLGFTFKYSKDIHGRNKKYLDITPSRKSIQKVKDKIKEHIKYNGHLNPEDLVRGLNSIIRGWLNYFTIAKVSYPAMAKRQLRFYMSTKLNKYYERKSQRKCKLCNHGAFQRLVDKYGLIDPTKYACKLTTVKA
ncbi:MAG: group II intron reverse transcriptase/maturase [Bacteroidetes bacterium]|nr:group II intron reverse transcriptase/maturase [Bacteroidota bacterium]